MARPSETPGLLGGIDVGGSALKLGVLARDGSRRAEHSLPVRAGAAAAEILGGAARALRELAPEGVAGVGVGLPGLLDREAGRVLHSPNLAWLEHAPVAELLAPGLGLAPRSIRLENDANVAALGEQWLGAARAERDLLLLTLGTGIGGGLILGGALHAGPGGLAGEVGHVVIDPTGPPCGCGARGCLERFASASAARQRALARGLPAEAPGDLERLAERARAAAGSERTLLEEIGYDLGRGLAAVQVLLDLRLFVFGGGFSAALDVLEPGIRRALREWVFGEREGSVRLVRATLGPSAGWIGAARLALG
ncbi:MAG TPA: ROK family protein [Planctomycetota bacterium]